MKSLKATLLLAGDIGGTKTNLGLYVPGKRRPVPKVIETYNSRDARHLETIIEEFLERNGDPIASACFGIAGPVVDGRCRTTNLPWEVSETRMKRRFNWPYVSLVNDLAVTALAIPLLKGHELFPLSRVGARRGQNIAILAPGTGLGEALLVYHDGRYAPVASEGGHVDFSPTCDEEVRLWRYLQKRFGHVSPERVLSGPGLVNIYSWLKHSRRYREPAWLRKRFQGEDVGKVITETAMKNGHPLCSESLRIFVSILGAVAGNLALTGMARGGVYLGGGISPKILPALKEGGFMKAFLNKGRFSGLMKEIPVRVILNDRAALLGAAHCAFEKTGG